MSVLQKTNYEEFKKLVYEKVKQIHTKRFPYNDFLFEYFEEE